MDYTALTINLKNAFIANSAVMIINNLFARIVFVMNILSKICGVIVAIRICVEIFSNKNRYLVHVFE